MSRLDDLIKSLCPDGVKFRKIKEVCTDINTGLNPRKFFKVNTIDAENYYVTIREMVDGNIIFSDKTDKINDEAMMLCNNRSKLDENTVLFSGTGTIGRIVVLNEAPKNWNIKEGVYALHPIITLIVPKYLGYVLQSSKIVSKYMNYVCGGTVKSIPMRDLKNVEIPVPPLEVQQEIVRILDNFTSLKETLELELESRKKQYEYYRNALIINHSNVPKIKLKELGTIQRGKRFVHADATDCGVPCIHYGELYTYYSVFTQCIKSHIREDLRPKMRYAKQGDVIIVGAGENNIDIGVGVALESNDSVAIHDACYILSNHNQNPRYISYFLRTSYYHNQIKKYVSEGKICSISADGLGNVVIPIPSIEEQNRIVKILDNFELLCNDIQFGLPAEIKSRQKQYEFYRDKLLTFKELNESEVN